MADDYPIDAFRTRKQLQQYIIREWNKGKRRNKAVKLWIVRPHSPLVGGYVGKLILTPPFLFKEYISGTMSLKMHSTYFPNEMVNFHASVDALLGMGSTFAFANFWFALACYNTEEP